MKSKSKTATQEVVMSEQNRNIRLDLQQIKFSAEFLAEWDHLNNSELGKAAFEMEHIGFKLRHLLWLRSHLEHQRN